MNTPDQIYSHSHREQYGSSNSQKNNATLNLKYKRKRRKASKVARKQRKINS